MRTGRLRKPVREITLYGEVRQGPLAWTRRPSLAVWPARFLARHALVACSGGSRLKGEPVPWYYRRKLCTTCSSWTLCSSMA